MMAWRLACERHGWEWPARIELPSRGMARTYWTNTAPHEYYRIIDEATRRFIANGAWHNCGLYTSL